MSPLIQAVVSKIKQISPANTAALRELQAVQKKLKETEAKLRQTQQSQSSHPTQNTIAEPSPDAGRCCCWFCWSWFKSHWTLWWRDSRGQRDREGETSSSLTRSLKTPLILVPKDDKPAVKDSDKEGPLMAEEVMNPSTPVIRHKQPFWKSTWGNQEMDVKLWFGDPTNC